MSLAFQIRDLIRPRREILKEAGVQPGFLVLDFGCGPGSCIPYLAEQVGPSGEVYALDRHPLAIRSVQKLVSRKGFRQVKPIQSDGSTGLAENSLDAVFLYDSFHEIDRPHEVLKELHRVLKPGGILSFRDPHMEEADFLPRFQEGGFFRLSKRGKRTYTFSKRS